MITASVMKGLINFSLSVKLEYVHASTIFFYDDTKLISLRNNCAIVKTAGAGVMHDM